MTGYDDRDGKIWMDGKLVDWRSANVHILSHALHYASSVFEGERLYNGKIFLSRKHSERLRRSGELLDMEIPYSVDEIEAAGYRHSREGAVAARLQDALALAPGRKPAGPSPTRRWELIEVDHEAGVVHRPPGVRIDSGGFGKGFAADLAVEGLSGFSRCVVGCGGDLRVGGASADPFEVLVEHPLTGERDQKIVVGNGGVATSGLNVRVWKREDGGFAHHLIDPSTGRPAWTGLVGVTALAPTAVEAEARSKAALLAGPGGGAEILRRHGGLIVHEDGEIEPIGPIRLQPNRRVVIPMNAVAA